MIASAPRQDTLLFREARVADLAAIQHIYNEGIEDRIATLDTDPKDDSEIAGWFADHRGRHCVVLAVRENTIVGWASLNRYSNRCAYDGVASLSIYIAREHRGTGIGKKLLAELEKRAIANDFHKIVLFTFAFNQLGQGLYRRAGYREVGVFRNQGRLDGKFVDVMAMEKLLAIE